MTSRGANWFSEPFWILFLLFYYNFSYIFSGQNTSKVLKVIDNRTPVLRIVRLEQQDSKLFLEKRAEFRQKIKKFMSENDDSSFEQIENKNESVQHDLEKSIDNVSLDETSKDVQDNSDTETGKDNFFLLIALFSRDFTYLS